MNHKRASSVMVMGLVLGVAGVASAQTLEPTPTATTTASPVLGETSPLRLGLTLAPMPLGSFKTKLPAPLNTEESVDAAFAFALAPTLDYSINQFFFVGLAPQYIFNVKGKDASGDAGSELDLRIRAGGNARIADTIMLFGYLAPGYSMLMFPGPGDDPKGFVLGFAGGTIIDLSPGLFASAEVGYQLGYQAVNDVDTKSNFMHIGVGLGLRL